MKLDYANSCNLIDEGKEEKDTQWIKMREDNFYSKDYMLVRQSLKPIYHSSILKINYNNKNVFYYLLT